MLSFLSVITNTVYLEYSFYKAVLITLKKIFRKNWVLSCWVALIEEDCYFHFQRINWLLDIANIPQATAIGLTTCQVYWVNWKVWHIGQLSTVNTSCWFLQIQIFFGIVKKLPELLGSAIRRNISLVYEIKTISLITCIIHITMLYKTLQLQKKKLFLNFSYVTTCNNEPEVTETLKHK